LTRDWVVDSSVVIKLFVPEDLADVAEELLRRKGRAVPDRFFVPDLLYPECANILWKYVRRFGYRTEKAYEDLARLKYLALSPVSNAKILLDSMILALDHGITAYDASYVALARQKEAPLVTADRKLIRKLEGSGTEICWLGDLTL
jgi:predicted nucleic acid-binding protein